VQVTGRLFQIVKQLEEVRGEFVFDKAAYSVKFRKLSDSLAAEIRGEGRIE
jgi:hypothetical protein